jgi:hypothetical protein
MVRGHLSAMHGWPESAVDFLDRAKYQIWFSACFPHRGEPRISLELITLWSLKKLMLRDQFFN